MIIHEVLPRLAAAGLRTGAIGITGESMGGYGALLLAERLASPPDADGRARFPAPAAVAALSPAVFGSYASARSASGSAFDSQADFDHNNVVTGLAALTDRPSAGELRHRRPVRARRRRGCAPGSRPSRAAR